MMTVKSCQLQHCDPSLGEYSRPIDEDYHLAESWYRDGTPSATMAPRGDPVAALGPDGAVYVTYQHARVLVLHKSTDGGQTWEKVNVVQPPPNAQYGIVLGYGVLPDRNQILLYAGRMTPAPNWNAPDPAQDAIDWFATGWTYFARSPDGGQTWHFFQQVDKQDAVNIQGLGRIMAVRDGSVIATATLRFPGRSEDETWLVRDYVWRSADRGKSFQRTAFIANHSGETQITQTQSGRLLGAVRTSNFHPSPKQMMLTVSDDHGRTWSDPLLVTDEYGTCPGEFVALPDGRVILVYCRRYHPGAGFCAKISPDEGKTWNSQTLVIRPVEEPNPGLYSSSVLLRDGTILTIAGQHEGSALQAIRWRLPAK